MYFPGMETLIASGISSVTPLLSRLFSSGPTTSEQLTLIVDAAERLLKTNLGQFQAGQISASQAVSVAWSLMDQMVSKCQAFGAAGMKSAAERDRRIDPSQLRWDWAAYYIDPIVGGVASAPSLPNGTTGTTPYGAYTRQDNTPLILAGAALVGAVIISRGRK